MAQNFIWLMLDGQPLQGVQSLMADADGKVWVAYGGEVVMFCLALEWDGEDEVNPVAEVGAVVSGGRRVLMVVEVEVISVAGGRRGGLRDMDAPDGRGGRGGRPLARDGRQAGRRPGGFAQGMGLWMWIRVNGPP